MINFTSIKYKNFLSSGNKFIEHTFEAGKKKLIIGKNGSGKSILIDALCFVLYNKAFRKCKKNQLVNSINKKNLIVELEFEIGAKEYKLRRGVSPVFTELYVDGILKDQDASSHDYQSYIENSILRMTENTFRQIVVLGSTAFVPFMRLGSYHRRLVIEDLLEIAVFSNMHEVIKKRSGHLQTEFTNLLNQIKLIDNSIEHKNTAMTLLGSSNTDLIEQNVKDINVLKSAEEKLSNELSELLTRTKNHVNEIKKTNNELVKSKNEKIEMKDLVSKITQNKNRVEGEAEFFKTNDTCHVCYQNINDSSKEKIAKVNNNKINEFSGGLLKINKLIDSKTQTILSKNNKIDKFNDEILLANDLNTDLIALRVKQTTLVELNETLLVANTGDIKEIKASIVKYKKQLNSAEAKKAEYMNDVNTYLYISKTLKDDGIKSKIIKTYLPIINKLIRKYLDIMEFGIDFRFDEVFNETIMARYKDNFAYGNFSEGQKLRIDLCLLFTWRELSRMKNSAATNLIILDEIADASLDIEGFDAFLKVLNVDKANQCAIIISHKPDGITASVDEIIKAQMVGNFTHMSSSLPEVA